MSSLAKRSVAVWAVVFCVLAGVAGVFAYAAVFDSRAAAFWGPPSDDEMIYRFQKHEQELDELLAAYRADPALEERVQALEMATLWWRPDREDIGDARLTHDRIMGRTVGPGA